MFDSLGFVQSVMAPILRKVAREERPAWDRPRRRPDTKPPQAPPSPVAAEETAEPDRESESRPPSHIDLRV
jgi:hypothetical protein